MISNAKITGVSLNMKNHGVLTFDISLEGCAWGCIYGGYVLGNGYLGAESFKGSDKSIECLMRIMDVIGVESWEDLKGQYCRVKVGTFGDTITTIGNIIEDKWFDAKEFFNKNDE